MATLIKLTEGEKRLLIVLFIWLLVIFVLVGYLVVLIKKIMKRQSALGCGLFVVDTLKPQNDASDRAWGEFSEVAKE